MASSRSHGSHRLSGRASFYAVVFLLAAAAFPGALWAAEPESSSPAISASAARQMDAIMSIKDSKTVVQNKIDSRLYLGLLHRRNDSRLASLTAFRFVQPEADGRVAVDIPLGSMAGFETVLQTVKARGGLILSQSKTYRTISTRVHLEDLEALAEIPDVRRVRAAVPVLADTINVSEGVKTHGADEARTFFGITGAGVKVGVISSGVDSLASLQASGDLPATVTVLSGQAGSGQEGAAMLEIVHDMAPGADLYFATGFNGEASFAQNILDLAAAGCDVIVDDVIYFDESPFQDGPVAQAVNTVTAAGVIYFSSAGNRGNKDDARTGNWEGDFLANGTPSVLAGAGPAHNFGDGGQSILVQSANGNLPVLIWAEDYDLSTGNASTDFDIYDLNGALTQILDSSTDTQNGVGGDDFPVEIIGGGTFTGERLVVVKHAAGSTSSVPMFNLVVFNGRINPALATSGSTRGHNSALNAFSVAATPAAASGDGVTPAGPYPGLFNSANASESFSSDGPRRILLNVDGSEVTPGNRTSTGGTARQKPDITAADGVSCAAPGFSAFYGTSAAAPHAASIAALLKSAVPSLTPTQVRAALVGSAIDIEAPGTDRDTGAGIVMVHAALDYAGAAGGPLGPVSLAVDAHAVTGDNSNHNGIAEIGETVSVVPGWANHQAGSQALTGTASNPTGPAGGTYSLQDTAANYGSIGGSASNDCFNATADCYLMTVSGVRPAQHWDATFTETLSTDPVKIWKLHIGGSFPDVPQNAFYPFIENLFHNGVTGGCSGGGYCPLANVTRAQMAVFLLKAKYGAVYIPPPATGTVFSDVPASNPFAPWIENLAALSITGGCGSGAYCPNNPVTRQQMAIFLLKTKNGSGYTPPAGTGIFSDVTGCPGTVCNFIEALYNQQITGGCQASPLKYCPANTNLRQQMAVFMVKTFGLKLYRP